MTKQFNPAMFNQSAMRGPTLIALPQIDWKKTWLTTSKACAEAGWFAKELTIVGTGIAILATLEAFSASYAFETASQRHMIETLWGAYPREALQMSALTMACGIAGFVFMRRSSLLLEDFRREVRRRGKDARKIALGFVAVAIWYAGCAFTYEQRMTDHERYIGSAAESADANVIAHPGRYDVTERQEARDRAGRLGMKPGVINVPDIGPFGLAAFLHALVMWSAGAMRRPTKVTWHERKAIEDGYEREDKKRALEQYRRDKLAQEKRQASVGTWLKNELSGLIKVLATPAGQRVA